MTAPLTAIRHVAIFGAGTMGHGIGQEFARAGLDVVLWGRQQGKLERAKEKIQVSLEEMARWNVFPDMDIAATMGRIEITTSTDRAVADADLVIEAVVEDLELKLQVFRDLDHICSEHTILASNTSSFLPSVLAAATERPGQVLATHFFYPPHLMPLVEIVRGPDTSDETVQAVHSVLESAGKSPVLVQKEAPGFIANRIQAAIQREALYIVQQGIASAQDVDLAVKDSFGRRLGVTGPIEMVEAQDGWRVTQEIHTNILPDLDASKDPSPLILEKIGRNELGPMTGKGFYEWKEQSLEMWKSRVGEHLMRFYRSGLDA